MSTALHLLSLPLELRLHILSYVFLISKDAGIALSRPRICVVPLCQRPLDIAAAYRFYLPHIYEPSLPFLLPPAESLSECGKEPVYRVLRVCRQLRDEGERVLYGDFTYSCCYQAMFGRCRDFQHNDHNCIECGFLGLTVPDPKVCLLTHIEIFGRVSSCFLHGCLSRKQPRDWEMLRDELKALRSVLCWLEWHTDSQSDLVRRGESLELHERYAMETAVLMVGVWQEQPLFELRVWSRKTKEVDWDRTRKCLARTKELGDVLEAVSLLYD